MKLTEFRAFFNVRSEMEDYDFIHEEIEKGVVFKGTNLWILIFAIVIASIGLNMNSTAIIIGAMLISPLMGPINGMGYSLATYDFFLFRKAVKNFSFAVGASLLTSTLYFAVTPVGTASSEILARTSPTIYDVLIALFGGLAGIIAMSTKRKGNVIPGVAIATALMPPICTAGYGLATLQFNFFFGALYLFTINTVFIGVASLFVCQFLRFPIRTIIDSDRKKRINQYISLILTITIVPSVYFGYLLVQNERFSDRAQRFVNEISVTEGTYLLDNRLNATARSIDLIYSGYGLSEESRRNIKTKALVHRIDTSKIVINSGTNMSIVDQSKQRFESEKDVLAKQLNAVEFLLQSSERKIDSLQLLPTKGNMIMKEIKPLYSQVLSCSYTESFIYSDSTQSAKVPIVILFAKKASLKKDDKEKIENWLKMRLQNKNVRTLFEEEEDEG
ncbi:MAG: DUF389 domain-containing protein [Bacteroidales bacterium]|jgi:uncharacterized hydrophobic protein (TIGR00271 family)|nr:DUF389 domain-containing protein [Bacteroidales bacterium]